jgi:hypothetical protein
VLLGGTRSPCRLLWRVRHRFEGYVVTLENPLSARAFRYDGLRPPSWRLRPTADSANGTPLFRSGLQMPCHAIRRICYESECRYLFFFSLHLQVKLDHLRLAHSVLMTNPAHAGQDPAISSDFANLSPGDWLRLALTMFAASAADPSAFQGV